MPDSPAIWRTIGIGQSPNLLRTGEDADPLEAYNRMKVTPRMMSPQTARLVKAIWAEGTSK